MQESANKQSAKQLGHGFHAYKDPDLADVGVAVLNGKLRRGESESSTSIETDMTMFSGASA